MTVKAERQSRLLKQAEGREGRCSELMAESRLPAVKAETTPGRARVSPRRSGGRRGPTSIGSAPPGATSTSGSSGSSNPRAEVRDPLRVPS